MSSTALSRRGATRALLVALACAIFALHVTTAPSASAVSRYSVWQGSPGALTRASSVSASPTYAGVSSKINMTAAHVNRSPATTGQQTVVYEYRVFTWNGREWARTWATYGLARTIPAGQQGAILDGNGFGGSIELPAKGYVAVELAVSFYSGNQLLGRFNIWHDQPRDYQCMRGTTLYGTCVVYNGGYVYVD